jgi:hypothetical protein
MAASVQSMTTASSNVDPGVRTTFHAWKSPCTRAAGSWLSASASSWSQTWGASRLQGRPLGGVERAELHAVSGHPGQLAREPRRCTIGTPSGSELPDEVQRAYLQVRDQRGQQRRVSLVDLVWHCSGVFHEEQGARTGIVDGDHARDVGAHAPGQHAEDGWLPGEQRRRGLEPERATGGRHPSHCGHAPVLPGLELTGPLSTCLGEPSVDPGGGHRPPALTHPRGPQRIGRDPAGALVQHGGHDAPHRLGQHRFWDVDPSIARGD